MSLISFAGKSTDLLRRSEMSTEVIDYFDERLRRESDRIKAFPRSDNKAWTLAVGAVNNMVILDICGMQPETAEGVERRMADNKTGLRGEVERLAQLFDIAFGVAGEKMRPMQAGIGQFGGQIDVFVDVDEIVSAGRGTRGAGMAANKAVGKDDIGQTIIEILHFPDIFPAAHPEEGFLEHLTLQDAVFIDLRRKTVVVAP